MGTVVDTAFEIGEIVYLRTDPHGDEYMVTGFLIRKTHTEYMLRSGSMRESCHEEIEIVKEKPFKFNN